MAILTLRDKDQGDCWTALSLGIILYRRAPPLLFDETRKLGTYAFCREFRCLPGDSVITKHLKVLRRCTARKAMPYLGHVPSCDGS